MVAHFKSSALLIFALLLVLGCASEQESPSELQKSQQKQVTLPDFSSINTKDVFVYNCGDSLQFTAHVTNDSTWLFLPDTALKVSPVPAGSGAKYQGSRYIYWSKGNEAILQEPTGPFMTCTTSPKEKSWQAARIRGVDFRALGQEPGWHLEITEGKQIRYVGSYGQDTVFTPVPNSKQTVAGQTVYEAQTEAHSLRIEISDELCTDSMSGFQFPFKVTITVDGETYRGCGRTLE